MSKLRALSKAEMEVARIVWDRQSATVREVLENLPQTRQIDYKTVQTFLRRLEIKGYLASRREGRSLVYQPIVRPDLVIKEAVSDFVSRLFDGQVSLLLEHLLLNQTPEPKELLQIRELLARVESRDSSA